VKKKAIRIAIAVFLCVTIGFGSAYALYTGVSQSKTIGIKFGNVGIEIQEIMDPAAWNKAGDNYTAKENHYHPEYDIPKKVQVVNTSDDGIDVYVKVVATFTFTPIVGTPNNPNMEPVLKSLLASSAFNQLDFFSEIDNPGSSNNTFTVTFYYGSAPDDLTKLETGVGNAVVLLDGLLVPGTVDSGGAMDIVDYVNAFVDLTVSFEAFAVQALHYPEDGATLDKDLLFKVHGQ